MMTESLYKMDVKSILGDLGLKGLKDYSRDYRYGEKLHLTIDKKTGNWYNYKTNAGGPLAYLVKEILNTNIADSKKWLKDRHNFTQSISKKTEIYDTLDCPEFFEESLLAKLIPNHSYWRKRGVSDSTLSFFEGGVVSSGKMANRYVFPIFNSQNRIVGFTGRSVNNHRIKWFHRGNTSRWVYPAFFNLKYLKNTREVIFVEGVGDMLKLWDCGIKNTLVSFGLNINNSILNFLFKIRPKKIYISFDNDESNAGEKAAERVRSKLLKHFDEHKIKIALASKKDFGEMSEDEIKLWHKQLKSN
jgi:5S rRNA maturation endonuclease (ribonuclease M5)